jgi:hypothetical protein
MKYTKKQKSKIEKVVKEIQTSSDLSRLWQIIHETKGIIISLNDKHCAEYIRKDEVEGVLTRLIKFK